MAAGSTVFRISVDLSNVDAGLYEQLEQRIAQHPSEDLPRVVARALAYCLHYTPELAWGRGLDEADDPTLFVRDPTGNLSHWIDLGHPSAERMHRASKAAPRLSIVSHKGKDGLVRERAKRAIHRVESIEVCLLEPQLVEALAGQMARNVSWVVVKTGGDLMVSVGDSSLCGQLVETTLDRL